MYKVFDLKPCNSVNFQTVVSKQLNLFWVELLNHFKFIIIFSLLVFINFSFWCHAVD